MNAYASFFSHKSRKLSIPKILFPFTTLQHDHHLHQRGQSSWEASDSQAGCPPAESSESPPIAPAAPSSRPRFPRTRRIQTHTAVACPQCLRIHSETHALFIISEWPRVKLQGQEPQNNTFSHESLEARIKLASTKWTLLKGRSSFLKYYINFDTYHILFWCFLSFLSFAQSTVGIHVRVSVHLANITTGLLLLLPFYIYTFWCIMLPLLLHYVPFVDITVTRLPIGIGITFIWKGTV